jgi:hypothetical protein
MSALSETRCTEQFDDFLSNHCPALPGKLVFAKLWGSWSHNTALPDSDFDFIAVYQAPTVEFLGLTSPKDTVTHDKPDWQAYELGRFAGLLSSGNPGIIECLFTDDFVYQTPEWLALKARRRDFLTDRAVVAYQKYAEGQLARLEKGMAVHAKGGEPNEKWAYHVVRLMQDALRISRGGCPEVVRTGAERDFLLGIRTGAVPLLEAIQFARETAEVLRQTRAGWAVAPTLDTDWLNRWVTEVRLAELRGQHGDQLAADCSEASDGVSVALGEHGDRDGTAGDPSDSFVGVS